MIYKEAVFLDELAVFFLVVDAVIFMSNGNDPWSYAAATNDHHD